MSFEKVLQPPKLLAPRRLAAIVFAVTAAAGALFALTTKPASASNVASAASAGVTNYVAYTNGTAGAANPKLAPVKIGWINNQGGSVLVAPTATNGAQFAVNYVNKYLGGVGGHPVKLVTCFIPNSEEEGTTCGDQMVNTPGIDAMAFGGVAVGAASLESVVAGKIPLLIGVSVTPGDQTNPNTYILFGSNEANAWPWGTIAKDRGAKTAAIIYPEGPAYQSSAENQATGLRAEGIKTTLVGLTPNSTDVTGALEAANVTQAGAIVPTADPTTCVEIAKALAQLNVDPNKVLATPPCLSASVAQALGDYPKWIYGTAQNTLDAKLPQTKAYVSALSKFGQQKNVEDPWYASAVAEVWTAVQWMNKVGYKHLSPSAVAKRAKLFKGPLVLGPPVIDCGAYPKIPASCADEAIFYKYSGNGNFTPVAGWIQPPPSLQPPKP